MRWGSAAALFALVPACGSPTAITPDAAIDAAVDAPSFDVTGHAIVRDAINDALHQPTVVELPWHSITASVELADGSTPPVTIAADGTFSFPRTAADQPYRLTVVTDNGAPVEYQLAAPHVEIAGRIAGHYDRTPPTAGTLLQVSLPGAPGGGASNVQTTGLWTQTQRSSGGNDNFTIDWTAAGSLSGTLGMLDASKQDRAYFTILDAGGTATPQYTRITNVCSADLTLTAGATTPATCALAAQPQDHCAHLAVHVVTEMNRLVTALAGGPSYPIVGYQWLIQAIPVASFGPVAGLTLATQSGNILPATDLDRDQTTFGNPFPGHSLALVMSVVRARTIALPSTTGVNLNAATTVWTTLAPDCSTTSDLGSVIAYPSLPTLDGVRLDNDGLTVALDRTRDHELAWSVAASGSVDYWLARVWAVVNVANTTQLQLRRTWVTLDPHVSIDPAVFEANTTYVVETISVLAFLNAAAGDFRTVGFPASPYGVGARMSTMFRVTN
jgi:hypothetical protein